VLEAHWAWDEVVRRLASADAEIAAAAAGALADLRDVRAFEPLVAAFDAHPDGPGASAIAAALQTLTGVSDWQGKDAAWWRAWWSKNGRDVTSSPAGEETR
jgi:hypothetical protein